MELISSRKPDCMVESPLKVGEPSGVRKLVIPKEALKSVIVGGTTLEGGAEAFLTFYIIRSSIGTAWRAPRGDHNHHNAQDLLEASRQHDLVLVPSCLVARAIVRCLHSRLYTQVSHWVGNEGDDILAYHAHSSLHSNRTKRPVSANLS